jgi:hypothetical protein
LSHPSHFFSFSVAHLVTERESNEHENQDIFHIYLIMETQERAYTPSENGSPLLDPRKQIYHTDEVKIEISGVSHVDFSEIKKDKRVRNRQKHRAWGIF